MRLLRTSNRDASDAAASLAFMHRGVVVTIVQIFMTWLSYLCSAVGASDPVIHGGISRNVSAALALLFLSVLMVFPIHVSGSVVFASIL